MWHEARRRERATQKLFSDHKKRAEKRREENRIDPSSLLQVHGVKSKVNLDPSTHRLADNSMVVWQGDQKTTIDRFDVRTTLSSLPTEERPAPKQADKNDFEKRRRPTILDANENEYMKKLLHFERYRLIMQNDLKKISETTRLSLVDKNDLPSEAKMRKLKNNWFGTSGETSISNDHMISNSHNSNARSQGVSIGFDYNVQSREANDDLPVQMSISNTITVPDLDDYDTELDLDSVGRLESNMAMINEVISRYGLSCEEFNVLADSTYRSAKEVIHKLRQVKNEAKRISHATKKSPDIVKQQDFYGPALPPDSNKTDDNKSTLSGNISPARQCSPSGVDLPSKVDDKNLPRNALPETSTDHGLVSQQTKDTPSTNSTPAPGPRKQSETINESSRDISSPIFTSSSSLGVNSSLKQQSPLTSKSKTATIDRPPQIQINLRAGKEMDKGTNNSEDTSRRERRAVTPLAYKRYCRSSRSLSRERTTSSRHLSRDSSTSSSTSSSSSSTSKSRTSSSSLTDSSYDSRSHSGSRRRRVRSRSPRYRHSRRSRHNYRKRERR
uniref:CLK4-associating serine/arginine rich protein n=1 Tax=Aceria tosichella TaxID=561515 RepID=A0A6G1SL94_9ACAR